MQCPKTQDGAAAGQLQVVRLQLPPIAQVGRNLHVPETQLAPAGQAWPHVPQLAVSPKLRSVQPPLQHPAVWPGLTIQNSPPEPRQPPQLVVELMLVQVPLQHFCPAAQGRAVQLPQKLPPNPFIRLTQIEPRKGPAGHTVSPGGQAQLLLDPVQAVFPPTPQHPPRKGQVRHFPKQQSCPVAHLLPHEPQLSGSVRKVDGDLQTLLQLLSPAGQAHSPSDRQAPPVGQKASLQHLPGQQHALAPPEQHGVSTPQSMQVPMPGGPVWQN